MTLQTQQVYGVPGDKQSNDIGVFAKRGGIILTGTTNHLDAEVGQFFKWLHVGSGGNLFYLTPDDQVDGFFALADNTFVPVVGKQVLSVATFDGESVATTCNNITWHGGE